VRTRERGCSSGPFSHEPSGRTPIPGTAGSRGSSAHCGLVENPVGGISHRDTDRTFAPTDACAARWKPAVGSSAEARGAATTAVMAVLRQALGLEAARTPVTAGTSDGRGRRP
jgi:hypothetical protein